MATQESSFLNDAMKLFRLTRKNEAKERRKIQEKTRVWTIFGSSLEDLEEYFVEEFGNNVNWLKNRIQKRKKLKPYGLELAGTGELLSELREEGLSAGAAITLTDTRDNASRITDEKNGIRVIPGDVFSPSFWRQGELDSHMEEAGAEKIDFIIARALGGLVGIPDNAYLYGTVLTRLYPKLTSSDGLMIFQLPYSAKEVLDPWIAKLNAIQGIEAELNVSKKNPNYLNFKLIKKENAPETLANLENVSVKAEPTVERPKPGFSFLSKIRRSSR